MQSQSTTVSIPRGTVLCVMFAIAAHGQGTLQFNGPQYWSGTNYYEAGMRLHVVLPRGGPTYDDMGIAPNGVGGTFSQDGTPYMIFHQQLNPYDYVAFSPTNGSLFGLTSVQLADPDSPSSSLLPISFVGFRADGSTVTNTFMTPGGGASSLLTYQFTSDFDAGLTGVEILSTRWAMDNLVFVPEPSAVSFVLLASGILTYVRMRRPRGR